MINKDLPSLLPHSRLSPLPLLPCSYLFLAPLYLLEVGAGTRWSLVVMVVMMLMMMMLTMMMMMMLLLLLLLMV
jgi:hypothetical protein